MAESKKFYSAKEAAMAVLAKTEQLLKAHSLTKFAVIPSLKPKAKPDDTETDPEANATPGADGAAEAAPEAAPVAAAPVAAAPAADPAAAGAKGNVTSPTKTNTETGGSSPGGASTGGVGSGIGGAGTGGAATGGASTGGAGTVNLTISGNSGTGSNSEGGAPSPITINISNIGGRTDAGDTQSGDGPGAEGEGGSGEGSGGGGGGAAPDEPDNFSTSGKDAKQKPAMKNDKMKKSEEFGYQLLRKTAENVSGMHNVQYFKLEKTEELFKAIAEADFAKAETGHERGVHSAIKAPGLKGGTSKAGLEAKVGKELGSHPAGKESISEAKKMHTGKLEQLKRMPKPNLTKSDAQQGKADHSNPPKKNSEMKPASSHPESVNATPAPGNNPKEQAEGNNADWGTSPQVKGHIKLAHFIGHTSAKKKLKQSNSNVGTAMGQPDAQMNKGELEKAHEDRSKMSGKSGMVRGSTEANNNQKGVNQVGNNGSSGGMSEAGNNVRNAASGLKNGKAHAIAHHKETLSALKAMPKPKLS